MEEGIQEKKAFARKHFGTEKANIACTFMEKNEEMIADDFRALSNQAFFEKYGEFIDRVIVNLNTFKTFADSLEDRIRALREISYEADLYLVPFLAKQGSKTLEVYLADRKEAELELVMYAYIKYRELFDTLASRIPGKVDRKLGEIDFCLPTNKKAPTALDYACEYKFCKNTEEVDDYIQKVKEHLINLKPR
ncbi:hypothetical protein CW306_00495 [Bacillus sp. BA3]|nr:hypothetical protein CW306_00495 [Bacillus sp. BA3]